MNYCIKDIHNDPALDLLSDDELELLHKNGTSLKFKKNETIIKQGTITNNIMFGERGVYKLHMEGSKHDIIMTLKKDHSFLGLSSIFSEHQTFQYSVTALDDCEIYFYDRSNFEKVLKQNISFSNEIIKYINHNFARIMQRFLCVAQKNARGKVAEMILCLSSNLYEESCFTMDLSRSELADFAGLSMENTIRILKEFNDDGMIKLNGRKVDIVQKELLEKVSEFG